MNRVVITGAGQVSPLGHGMDEFFANLEAGRKGINNIEGFNSEYFPTRLGGEAKSNGKVIKFPQETDRKAEFIRRAVAELADNNPGLFDYAPGDRIAHFGAGIDYFDLVSYIDGKNYADGDWNEFCYRSTRTVLRELAGMYGFSGGCSVNVAACVASTQAIGLGFRMVKRNPNKIVISGGFDSMLCPLHYLGFYKLGALSAWEGPPEESCRPFDKRRCGLVIGEGAAALSLQSYEKADKNKILGEIVGYSSTMDSYMPTDPLPDGRQLAKAALTAIEEAGISPDDIDCAHLHGTGTYRNEPAETEAMKKIFGKRYNQIPVFSLKGHVGHLIGACGALEILAALHCLEEQKVMPTANFETPDPEADLFVVRGKPYHTRINYILKLNAGFGGQNAAIALKRYE